MRLPSSAHDEQAWLIKGIIGDLQILDVWALPMEGEAGDFGAVLQGLASFDPKDTDSLAARALWRVREILGVLLRLDEEHDEGAADDSAGVTAASTASLRERVPEHLRDSATGVIFGSVPFVPLYRTDVEFAAELRNKTVHGVIHLGWVDQGEGRYRAHMTIYVKPRGLMGKAYMTLITPFRHLVVYPALMRQIERDWNSRAARRTGR